MQDSNLNLLTSRIIEAAINVHTELGPGLLESVYSAAMVVELDLMGIDAKSEISVPVYYRGNKISDEGFRMDLLVEDTIIVELKSVDIIKPIHKKQLLTYLKLSHKPLGLLINFNNRLLKDGIVRIANSPQGDVT
jgi:GxxExxY protein